MKLAEALALRAQVQTHIVELEHRIMHNARHQEGDEPAEDPATLLAEVRLLADQLQNRVRSINRTNSVSRVDDGTVTDAIARRDVLALRRRVIRTLQKRALAGATESPVLRSSTPRASTCRRCDAKPMRWPQSTVSSTCGYRR